MPDRKWQQGEHRVTIGDVEETRLLDDVVKEDPESPHPFRSASRASFRSRRESERRITLDDRAPREVVPSLRATSRSRIISRSLSPTPSIIPECYLVTSDLGDDYSRARSTEELYKEIQGLRTTIDKSTLGTRFVEHMIDEKEHLTKVFFRRKKFEERERFWGRRAIKTREDLHVAEARAIKLEWGLKKDYRIGGPR